MKALDVSEAILSSRRLIPEKKIPIIIIDVQLRTVDIYGYSCYAAWQQAIM